MRTIARLLVLPLAVVIGSAIPAGARDDSVKHTIVCPEMIFFKPDWPNKISSDPALKIDPLDDKKDHGAHLRGMSRAGQKITCSYGPTGSSITAHYHYTVERQIIQCDTATKGRMQCELKP
jgi:hypothetical protein